MTSPPQSVLKGSPTMALADEGRGVMALIQRPPRLEIAVAWGRRRRNHPLALKPPMPSKKLNAFVAHKVECAMLIVLEVRERRAFATRTHRPPHTDIRKGRVIRPAHTSHRAMQDQRH